MKTIGIIGGMGPETSADFYLELIHSSHKVNKTQRPAILLWNVPIPFNVEEDLILKGVGEKRYVPFLIDGAKRLERGGADFIVIPCNTVHIFIEDIRRAVSIPVLSIVEETTKVLEASRIKKVGLLSTELTVRKKIYSDIFFKKGITPIILNTNQQEALNHIIQNILIENASNKDREILKGIITTLRKGGAEAIVLACTDLQHILHTQKNREVFDTMRILADASVKKILGNDAGNSPNINAQRLEGATSQDDMKKHIVTVEGGD